MGGFKVRRLGMVMESESGNPQEVEGVSNPRKASGPDGNLYLFPRLVAKGNYSRIGIARVRFNRAGDPIRASGWASPLSRRPIMNGGLTAAVAAQAPLCYVCGASSTISDDLHGMVAPWPADCLGGI